MNLSFRLLALCFCFCLMNTLLFAQSEPVRLYNPEADAAAEIEAAVLEAGVSGKHVFL